MSKPGEYELPELPEPYTYSEMTGIPLNSYNEVEEYGESCAAAVEKAHAEQNCGNCEYSYPYNRTDRHGSFICHRLDSYLPIELSKKLKCNHWESKEENNG